MRFIFRVDSALPTLLKIAQQFEGEDEKGKPLPTLKDQIDELVSKSEEQNIQNRWAVKIAEDSRLVAQTNAKIVEELTSTQTTDLLHIREYMHEKMHQLGNQIAVITLQVGITDKKASNIESRLDGLIPLVVRHRSTDTSDDEGENT